MDATPGGRPRLTRWLSRLERRRIERDPVLRALHAVPPFKGLALRELMRLKSVLHHRTYARNETLFEIGQPGAAMFIVLEGAVQILLHDDEGNQEVELATLEPGAFLGELALLDDSPRSATALAVEKTTALAVFRGDLERLLDEHPVLGTKVYRDLARVIARRLRSTNAQLSASERLRLGPTPADIDDEDELDELDELDDVETTDGGTPRDDAA